MKGLKLNKILYIFVMSAVCAGIIFCACGFCRAVPRGVTVNGVEVGGMSYVEAARAVRERTENYLKSQRLRVYADDNLYEFAYPELGYTDNVYDVLKNSRKNGAYAAETSYYLKGAKEIAKAISRDISRPQLNPYALFSAKGKAFEYHEGEAGRFLDENAVHRAILRGVSQNFSPVYLKSEQVEPTETLAAVKGRTRLLYGFYTEYDEGNAARANNIKLAAAAVNGTIIKPGGVFSFNAVVGKRAAERGYLSARIISGGRYVNGVGGGVCQVSTTLYNAALLSGLEIRERYAHSLCVGYVSPSRDAMVSGVYCDLKFCNTTPCPVYIRADASGGRLLCRLYGKPDGWEYSFESEVVESLPPPQPEGEGEDWLVPEREGVVSEGYLVCRKGDEEVKRLVSRDIYSPVQGIKKQKK